MVLLVAFTPSARASQSDKKTFVTFRETVELPGGAVLQPGEYTMKVLGSPTGRGVVQVTNRDGTKVYATILPKFTERMKRTGETVITLHEAAVGKPRPLCVWFYPGSRIGWEFHPMARM